MKTLQGSANFRERLLCAILAFEPIEIINIRQYREGLRDHEICLLRLIQHISHGSRLEISEDNCSFEFHPGSLIGGNFTFHCDIGRCLSYYMLFLMTVGAFCREGIDCTLYGVTTHNKTSDVSVHFLKHVAAPLYSRFLDQIDINILSYGFGPNGGGVVKLFVPEMIELKSINSTTPGKYVKVGGVSYGGRIAANLVPRLTTEIRRLLDDKITDLYINNDHRKGRHAGESPGFACCLYATSVTNTVVGVDSVAQGGESPEDVSSRGVRKLLSRMKEESGASIPFPLQEWILPLMALNQRVFQRVMFGRKVSSKSIVMLKLIRHFFNVKFSVQKQDSGCALITCRGKGYTNMSRSAI
ncbi:hypothetical protein PCE1_001103 [Barthelona sp. PCE]